MIRYLIGVKYWNFAEEGVVSGNEELVKKDKDKTSPHCLLLSLGQDKLFQWHSILILFTLDNTPYDNTHALSAYIQKAEKMAETTFQPRKIGGKGA